MATATTQRVAAENRKARFNYFIEDTVEAGIMLVGTEVKSLREGHADLTDAHALERGGEMFLVNCYIPEFKGGNRFNHEPKRERKLLLHKREIDKLAGAVNRSGYTVVPLKLYFNERGYAKVLLGIARGKKQHDKRATIKDRDWKRDQARIMRGRN